MIGAGLLILAGSLFAKSKTAALKAHLTMLSSLTAALQVLQSEIQVNLTPVGDILAMLSDFGDRSSRWFFREVSEQFTTRGAPYLAQCWNDAVVRCCSELSEEEQRALCTLGEVLGRYGVEEECAAINRCISELNIGLAQLRQRYYADVKLYTGLGLTAGCILAIVLL
jgi:stage III sporulation protein AB